MDRFGDHDGKSKSASAVDVAHYPDPGVESDSDSAGRLTHQRISERAHHFWLQEGCPEHCAERHWQQAENELRDGSGSKNLIEKIHQNAGSVQP